MATEGRKVRLRTAQQRAGRKPPAKSAGSRMVSKTVDRKGQYDTEFENVVEESSVEPVFFEGEAARVEVGAGITKNTGNYESLRVYVSVNMPCHPSKVDATAKQVGEQVNDLLMAEVEEYLR